MLIILSTAISSGAGTLCSGAFAVGTMSLVWHRREA
jgi:hypothetical protein